MKEQDLVGGGVTKQWLACFEQLKSKVDYRMYMYMYGRGKHFGAHFGLCLLRRFPFLVDPGTGIPIENDLPTLGKRTTYCVAHTKQDKTVIYKIVFNQSIGFLLLIKGLCFRTTKTKTGC